MRITNEVVRRAVAPAELDARAVWEEALDEPHLRQAELQSVLELDREIDELGGQAAVAIAPVAHKPPPGEGVESDPFC